MDFKLTGAVVTGKILKATLRAFGSGATAAPGLASEYIDQSSLRKLAKSYPNLVLISGTNGKTTTAKILSEILNLSGIDHIDNREGSNLVRGLTASLVDKANLAGRSKVSTAVFEVDEAVLPVVISSVAPKIIILNNLFRDQLDRYGEVETIRKLWQKAVKNLDSSTTLLLNADDPACASLTNTRAKIIFFGIEDKNLDLGSTPHAADFLSCTTCGGALNYSQVFLSHLGKYKCENGDTERPKPALFVEEIETKGLSGSRVSLNLAGEKFKIESPLPGIYNVYNLLAASSAAFSLGMKPKEIKEALENFKPAFGRTETVNVGGKRLYLSLVKNPTGFNEVIRTIFADKEKRFVLIAINDLIADGRDVSWLWDVDFETLVGKAQKVLVSGIRAADMELRLKYAGVENVERIDDLQISLEKSLNLIDSGETIFIMPTYTAMLKIKSILAKKGYSGNFWEN